MCPAFASGQAKRRVGSNGHHVAGPALNGPGRCKSRARDRCAIAFCRVHPTLGVIDHFAGLRGTISRSNRRPPH